MIGNKMKLTPVGETVMLFLWAVLAITRPADAQTKSIEYELIIGERLHKVALGVPFTIVTPRGEKLDAVLRQKEWRAFSDYGLSFNYSKEMTVSSESTSGVPTIYLEMTQSPFAMIQVYSAPNTVESILSILKQSFETEFKSRKAEFFQDSGRAVTHQIGGSERAGVRLSYVLGGQKMLTDVFAFSKNDKVVALILQHDTEDAELAERVFQTITDTLK